MTFPQENFIPGAQLIAGFTFSNPGIITTAQPHNYKDGLLIRLTLPGLQDSHNNQIFRITVLSPTTFSLNADTSNFPVIPPSMLVQVPQVIPVGEVAETLQNALHNASNIIPET